MVRGQVKEHRGQLRGEGSQAAGQEEEIREKNFEGKELRLQVSVQSLQTTPAM